MAHWAAMQDWSCIRTYLGSRFEDRPRPTQIYHIYQGFYSCYWLFGLGLTCNLRLLSMAVWGPKYVCQPEESVVPVPHEVTESNAMRIHQKLLTRKSSRALTRWPLPESYSCWDGITKDKETGRLKNNKAGCTNNIWIR